jgi:hypothetical protein
MSTTFKDLKARQTKILEMISRGWCSVNCAAAIHTDGSCFCRCGGLYHGALWVDEIAAEYDRCLKDDLLG